MVGSWSVLGRRGLAPLAVFVRLRALKMNLEPSLEIFADVVLDPAFPESIRRALPALPPGQPSAAIAVESGYAVVIVDAVLAPSDTAPSDAALRRELTIRKTRLAMESLARELVARTEISALDASLR